MGIGIFGWLFDEVSRNYHLHVSNVHDHFTVRQVVDLIDLPTILASAAPLWIPGMGIHLIRSRQHQ